MRSTGGGSREEGETTQLHYLRAGDAIIVLGGQEGEMNI